MPSGPAKDWRALLARHHQPHVADRLEALSPERRARLVSQLEDLDLPLVEELAASVLRPARKDETGPLSPPAVRKKGADPASDEALRVVGRRLLSRGKVACVLVAGGQGSRLKHPGPKGTYPATPVRKKPLFQVFAEKLLARTRQGGAPIPLCIMTSVENDAETRAYFQERRTFGLPEDRILFFTQGMLPAVDESGRLVLKEPDSLFLSPNGHGGTLLALRTSGLLDALEKEGVEHLFYFQVDNPLVDLCDPLFLGFHAVEGSEFSSKVVAKAGPGEKVGVLCNGGGKMTLIEYSDLPKDLREACGPRGDLLYSAGNIATHVLSLAFVKRLTEGRLRLPFHMARKALPVTGLDGAPAEVAGIKFETFVFDALAFADKAVALEVRREDEFAPIKNAAGVDSPETSLALQSAFAARMIEAAGVSVPKTAAGAPYFPIEISPLFAAGPEDLRGRLPARLSFDAPLYLGDD